MKKTSRKPLRLTTEIIRSLEGGALGRIGGGLYSAPLTCGCPPKQSLDPNNCDTNNCPW